jgi:(p)ppGpp synthase/HD superfamily hydrolase
MGLIMIEKAFRVVEEAFKDKFDKGGKPYINHLLSVSSRLTTDEEKTVGLLHDLLEDCFEWNEEKLSLEFPNNIVESVVCLTKIKGEKYSDYLNRVKTNEIALKVKISDLKDNMDLTRLSKLTDKDLKRIVKYHESYHELIKYLNNED